MAVYVLLLKEYEDETKVIYKYGPNEGTTGKIGYDKKLNKLMEIEPITKEGIPNDFYLNRAARKLALLSVKGNGEFPEKTSIES